MRVATCKFSATYPAIWLLTAGLAGVTGTAQVGTSSIAPIIARYGKNMGLEDPNSSLTLTVWLNMHNREGFDARVKDLYAASKPSFHKWLTDNDLRDYLPTKQEVDTVQAALESSNLSIESVDPLNLSVRVHGSVSNIEKAFHAQVNRYMVNGELVHTTSTTPRLDGAAVELVQHVSGLNSMELKPMLKASVNPGTGKKYSGVPLSKAGPDGLVFSSQCFYEPEMVELDELHYDYMPYTEASYSGLVYGHELYDPSSDRSLPPCGYSASQVQGYYGLGTAYELGYTGEGQTIVITESYLQPTAEPDLVAFSKLNHLPLPSGATFKLYNPFGAIGVGADHDTGVETDIDVQWAHAIAPGAEIALLQTFSANEEDQQAGILYAVSHHLGDIISLSYGYPESNAGPLALTIFNEVVEIAAAEGVSFLAASGDSGDDSAYGNGADVNAPADSPYATAVGGTSVAASPGSASPLTVGWGNNVTLLSDYEDSNGYLLEIPPFSQFFAGSGGGASAYFAKPAYQSALPGSKRLMPDVSALAGPLTGAEIVSSDPSFYGQTVTVYGGTSLATPIIAGNWAIVEQAAGAQLGQVAPYAAAAPDSVIKDVLPISGTADVSGSITDPYGAITQYSAADLAQPLYTTTQFVSALRNGGQGDFYVMTFGTDSSLTVTQGWDNVTGYGTPDVAALFALAGIKARK